MTHTHNAEREGKEVFWAIEHKLAELVYWIKRLVCRPGKAKSLISTIQQ